MPHRFLRAVDPIVAHGLREMSVEGASLEHTLRQVALMGALVGTGLPPVQAIRQVELFERQLLPFHPGEFVEPYHFAPPLYGKPTGKAMMPYGKPTGKATMPYGKPTGKTKMPYGKPTGKAMMPYGQWMTPDMGMGPYMGGAR